MELREFYRESCEKLFTEYNIHPESLTIQTQGPCSVVHYLKLGRGEPLFLIHGGGSHCLEWLPVLKPLSRYFEVYALDAPGFGLNDPFDFSRVSFRHNATNFLKSVFDALKINQAQVVANSMGGYYATNFTLDHPEMVKKLVLIGATAGLNHWIPLPLRLMGMPVLNIILMKTVARPSMKSIRSFHRQLLVADDTKLSDAYIQNTVYHMNLTAKSTRSLFEKVLTRKGFRRELMIDQSINKLAVPVRIIWGDKDAFESPDSGFSKVRNIIDLQFEVVKNAGHLPWIDQPENCSSLLIKMLDEPRNYMTAIV